MPHVTYHTTVVRDGMHNAFTSMVFWQNQYWVGYRKGPWHWHSPMGACVLAVSQDRVRWREIATWQAKGDVREPRLVVMGDDKLAVLLPVMDECAGTGENTRMLQEYIRFSSDGWTWTEPELIMPPREQLFRVRKHDDVYYGLSCYRNMGEDQRLTLYTSSDLLDWRRVSQIGPDRLQLNEADIEFDETGRARVVARCETDPNACIIATAPVPYTQWAITELPMRLHGPCLFRRHGRSYVAGRCHPPQLGETTWAFGNSLCIWRLEDSSLTPVMRLPATGDSTYPDLVEDGHGRLCMSYYSQHASQMGVLPPFGVTVEDSGATEGEHRGFAADVFFATLELEDS